MFDLHRTGDLINLDAEACSDDVNNAEGRGHRQPAATLRRDLGGEHAAFEAQPFVTAELFGIPYPSVAAFLSDRGAEVAVYLVCAYLIGLVRMSIASSDGRSPIDAPSRMD